MKGPQLQRYAALPAMAAALTMAACNASTPESTSEPTPEPMSTAAPTPTKPRTCTGAPADLSNPCANDKNPQATCVYGDALRVEDPALYDQLVQAAFSDRLIRSIASGGYMLRNYDPFRQCTDEQEAAIGAQVIERIFADRRKNTGGEALSVATMGATLQADFDHSREVRLNSRCSSINVVDPCSDMSGKGCWRAAQLDSFAASSALAGSLADDLRSCAWDLAWNDSFDYMQYCEPSQQAATVTRSMEQFLRAAQRHARPSSFDVESALVAAVASCTRLNDQREQREIEDRHREEVRRAEERGRDRERRRSGW